MEKSLWNDLFLLAVGVIGGEAALLMFPSVWTWIRSPWKRG
jgi:hypothetical protein